MQKTHALTRAQQNTKKLSERQAAGPWDTPGPVPTFLRCLRLLNFDQREDWPGLTEETFSTSSSRQNLQARIKGVEWSLYRLIELWDLEHTGDVGDADLPLKVELIRL